MLYAQIVTRQKVNVNDIDEFCTNYRHTSSGEIKLMFSLLRDVIYRTGPSERARCAV